MANREELVIIRGARAGDAASQLALGKLYLFGGAGLPCHPPTALHWLCRAAEQGVESAWQLIGCHISADVAEQARELALPWLQRAAAAGLPQASAILAQWQQAVPAVVAPASAEPLPAPVPPTAWQDPAGVDGAELLRLREEAAQAGDRGAQLALGLQLARMSPDGDRLADGGGTVNFKRALRWLAQAGEQGLADAWFAMSRIYIRPEFSQRSASEAQACLERAAGLGHSAAQLACGMHAWRARRGDEQSDVKAAYWLQQAAAQGSHEAQAALARIAPAPVAADWAEALLPLTRGVLSSQPLLAARIELAVLFGLTRAEALLLDVAAADHGHCLVVDIRASYGRGKRRLVLVDSAPQRQALDRSVRLFEQVDTSLEGNYRQRLYRLKTWLTAVPELLAA
jgi:TPR repeat protein